MKGFLVAAERSGSGKTTLTTGIVRSLSRKGVRVAPFKCGPDYIDTLHLGQASGVPAHNLDTVMMPEDALREVFALGCAGRDVCVAEGVMGLFDGIRPENFLGSSYDVASRLGLPVLLVLNAASSSYSMAAVLKGFQTLAEKTPVAGVVLNNVASANHEKLLCEAVRMHTDVPVTGCVPKMGELLSSRHLGVKTALETSAEYYDQCADIADKYINISSLEKADITLNDSPAEYPEPDKVCLAAFDRAFNFYYEANFHELRKRGYRIKKFSPLCDEPVEDADLLYMGGGYPELYADELSKNKNFIDSLRAFCDSGRAVLAECGGMMVLTKGIHTSEGYYPMTGFFDAECRMTAKRQALGYVRTDGGHVGHEFHYSAFENVKEPYYTQLTKLTNGKVSSDGFYRERTYGGYAHFHFMGEPSILDMILEQTWKKG